MHPQATEHGGLFGSVSSVSELWALRGLEKRDACRLIRAHNSDE